jgi:hypothetical protein
MAGAEIYTFAVGDDFGMAWIGRTATAQLRGPPAVGRAGAAVSW